MICYGYKDSILASTLGNSNSSLRLPQITRAERDYKKRLKDLLSANLEANNATDREFLRRKIEAKYKITHCENNQFLNTKQQRNKIDFNSQKLVHERKSNGIGKACKDSTDLLVNERPIRAVVKEREGTFNKPLRRPLCPAQDALKRGLKECCEKDEKKEPELVSDENEIVSIKDLKERSKNPLPEYEEETQDSISASEIEDDPPLTDLGGYCLEAKIMFKAFGPKNDPLNKPFGIAQLHSGNIVVADTLNNRLVMFDCHGKYLNNFSAAKGLHYPSGIVVLSDGSFAVKDSNSITVFSESCTVKASNKLWRPYGLTLSDAGNLITIETGTNGILAIVTVDPESCDIISKVYVDLCLKPWEMAMSKPRFIACQGGSHLLVVDIGLNCVYIVDMVYMKVLHAFGKDIKMKDPSGIVCDSEGFVLLTDSQNHRVLLFSPDGTFISIVKMDIPVRQPSDLYLTSSGNLLVLNSLENSLAQYDLQLIIEM